jgi:glycosyltransferase involved in cell wall biosynthesis
MAHIFKKYNKETKQKGIFVITHKEVDIFNYIPKKLRDLYYIGVHYGSAANLRGARKQEYQDFCMGAESTVSFLGEKPFRIPYNSRAFTPSYFSEDKSIPKYWDVINISRNANVKRLDQFLLAVRNLYDMGHTLKILLVVPSCHNEKPNTHFVDIVKVYEKMFNRKERESFTLMRLSAELGFLGISPATIAHFYKSSKAFCLLSSAEGESRVIHEALLCGLPVVCYSGLLGGGRDYLDDTNSAQFDDYSKIHLSLLEAAQKAGSKLIVNTDRLSRELSEIKTIPKLKQLFEEMYNKDGNEFDGELTNTDELNLRLPAHYLEVPWNVESGNGVTADIISKEQMTIFIKELMK